MSAMAFNRKEFIKMHGIDTLGNEPIIRPPLPLAPRQRRVILGAMFDETYETGMGLYRVRSLINQDLEVQGRRIIGDDEPLSQYLAEGDYTLDANDEAYLLQLVQAWEQDPSNHE